MTRVRSVTSSRNQQKPTNSSVKNRDGKRNYPSKNQEYITEPEELDIIEAILDNAISEIPEDVENLRGFFDFAEEQSEELTFKNGEMYPLVITSYPEGKGQITGFTVAFADDPDRYVAGSKIMAGYEDDLEKRHKFSPKNLAEELGFDHEEKEQRKENTILRSSNTKFSKKPKVQIEEDDFDSNADEWEEQKQTQSRVRRRIEEKDSSKTKNNSNPNNKTEKDISEEADAEDLLENEGVLGKVAKNRKSRPEPQSTRESSEKRNSSNSSKSFLKSRSKDAGEELGRFATQLANQGHEINGINLTGEILQAAIALGIITSAGIELLAKSLEEAREGGLEKRAEKIEEKIKNIVERMEEVTDDYQGLQQQSRGKSTAQEQVESRQTPNADQRPSLAETGDDVNKLSSELLSPKTKFIPPLNLNQNDSIDERLDRIEKYLDNLSKRLDRLEEKIAELKEQQDSKSAVGTQSPLSLTPEPAIEKIARDSPQDSTIAEALVNFALAVEAKNNEEMSLGNNTLRVKNVGQGEILVSLKSEEDIEILRATKANGEWVSSESSERLDDDEKKKILSLPQSKEEVDTINTARHFVETLEESFPKHFKNSCDFQITGPGEREDVDVVLYSFQIDELKNNSKILEATDPKSALVFRAELREGYAPEIKKCDIPTEEMEEVITVYEKEREKEKAELNRGTRTLNHRPSETNQDEEQL